MSLCWDRETGYIILSAIFALLKTSHLSSKYLINLSRPTEKCDGDNHDK